MGKKSEKMREKFENGAEITKIEWLLYRLALVYNL